jgi:subtilase family serine protease
LHEAWIYLKGEISSPFRLRSRPERAVLVVAVVCLLSFSFLQALPLATAQVASHDAAPAAVPQGFKLRGAAPAALPVLASIAIPLRNLDLLSSLVKQVSDPTSPLFGQSLTDQQIAQDFLPTPQYDGMMQYLSTTPLQVQFTALDSVIVVRGTVAQLSEYLGTGVSVFSNGTASYYMSSAQTFHGAYVYASNSTYIFAKKAVTSQPTTGANVTFTSGAFTANQLQAVYNATGLYSHGINGAGETIGVLDWFGSPTIAQDLKAFDKQFGFTDPKFQILPIGPYDPNLGAYTGWSTEISLDVETSHAMAPGANVDLYIANNALTQMDAIAAVVKDNKVNTLSQSYTFPEWIFNYLPPQAFMFNVLLPDSYYQLGALKGITFTGSTGDTGGSGYTSGVEGELGYPASSPYVTALGGTQTYFSGSSFVQTAWSNLGFVPNGVNYGGSTGGVSILEPLPWYQSIFPTPPSFPNGRMNPDISLQGGIDPGTYIVDSGRILVEGGTSESSPLFAGLVTLIDQYVRTVSKQTTTGVGLINPFLYQLAGNPATYAKSFSQVSFGYNVPWTTSSRYNLVTGLGAPNIGEMASLYASTRGQSSLNITVQLSRGSDTSGLEHTPGSALTIGATISGPSGRVTSGSFTASIVTLASQTPVTLTYNSGLALWTGLVTMGSQSGIAYVQVQGTSGGVSGSGMASFFAGYLGVFYSPVPTDPWSTIPGLDVIVQSLTLDGTLSSTAPIQVEVDSYSILTNQYSQVDSITLLPAVDPIVGQVDGATVNATWPTGPITLVLHGGTFGYLVFTNGVYLQTTYIYSEVAAEPGSVAAGQKLTIIADPIAPLNLYYTTSQETGSLFGTDLEFGSNVTAYLVDNIGSRLSIAHLAYQPCTEALRVCLGGANKMNGYLQIPSGLKSGLYTIILTANYTSFTVGQDVSGSFFSQIWVANAPLTPKVTVLPGPVSAKNPEPAASQSALFQGQTAHVEAQISYPNGTAVKYGEFTAVLYPQELANDYTSVMHNVYSAGALTYLVYNPSIGAWVGNMTLPSSYNPGDLAVVNNNSFFYSGPYDVYVSGLTADGFPTTTAISAQRSFFIQPYTYMTGIVASLPQTSGLAFSGATISSAGSLTGDLFLGSNTVSGASLSITGSQIQGTLTIANSHATLTGVSGGDVTAVNSSLLLLDSSIGTLTLTASNATLSNSSFQRVSPAQAAISFGAVSPQPASGKFNVTATITGQLLKAGGVSMWLDGTQVTPAVSTSSSGLVATAVLDASSLADGVHSVALTVTQSDGMTSSASMFVTTNSHISTLGTGLQQANQLIGQLGGQVANLTSQLKSTTQQLGTFTNFSYGLAVVAVVGVAVAVMALRRKPPAPAS